PNMIKAILEYTAQPLAGYNNLVQGTGELNIEGCVRLAGLIRTDFLSQPLGAPLLNGAAPNETSTIAGYTFSWGGAVLQKWNVLTGHALITQKQGIYGSGVNLSDGVALADGTLLGDVNLLASTVLLSDGVLYSDGSVFANSTVVTYGTLLGDGT